MSSFSIIRNYLFYRARLDANKAAAGQAHELGNNAEFSTSLGGKSGQDDQYPYVGRLFRVEALSNGEFPFTGAMYAGMTASLGLMAVLRVIGYACRCTCCHWLCPVPVSGSGDLCPYWDRTNRAANCSSQKQCALLCRFRAHR